MSKDKLKNKEKIELKHLAAYLPYALRLANYEKKHEFILLNLYKLFDIDVIEPNIEYDGENSRGYNMFYRDKQQFFPILKPLSKLTEEEVKGLKITLGGLSSYGILKRIQEDVLTHANYHMIEYLLSNHYDIFGLIKKGFAIENLKPIK